LRYLCPITQPVVVGIEVIAIGAKGINFIPIVEEIAVAVAHQRVTTVLQHLWPIQQAVAIAVGYIRVRSQ
jgi:hypothetical protein